jgi:predicted PurR-regulated permease PerM
METQQMVIVLVLGLLVLVAISFVVFPKITQVDDKTTDFLNDTLNQNLANKDNGGEIYDNIYISLNEIINKPYNYARHI